MRIEGDVIRKLKDINDRILDRLEYYNRNNAIRNIHYIEMSHLKDRDQINIIYDYRSQNSNGTYLTSFTIRHDVTDFIWMKNIFTVIKRDNKLTEIGI